MASIISFLNCQEEEAGRVSPEFRGPTLESKFILLLEFIISCCLIKPSNGVNILQENYKLCYVKNCCYNMYMLMYVTYILF